MIYWKTEDQETGFIYLNARYYDPEIVGGFNLILHGGDTATSYDAVLTFKQGYLYSKKVTLWEFPTQRWEETFYSFTKN